MPVVAVSELQGLWRRSLIEWPDGGRDTTTVVRWLQGASAFADLRQPCLGPDFAQVHALAELSLADCAWLARQEGFAGRLGTDGAFFEWARTIDFQPQSPHADVGALWWEGQLLVEHGRDIDYLEHWQRAAAAGGPTAALALRDPLQGVRGVLLRVGADFMYARDRAIPLPALPTLGACIAAAAGTAQARALVDCEISYGSVQSVGFRILASTLPYRVGDLLGQRLMGDALIMQDRLAPGMGARRWDVIDVEGDAAALAAG
ncbi:MAG: hypothetical protein WB440_08085 [Steroidobacteraceae bacterium]